MFVTYAVRNLCYTRDISHNNIHFVRTNNDKCVRCVYGTIVTGQMAKPTVSKHWKNQLVVELKLEYHQNHFTMLQLPIGNSDNIPPKPPDNHHNSDVA